jgi:hypothetical protein
VRTAPGTSTTRSPADMTGVSGAARCPRFSPASGSR